MTPPRSFICVPEYQAFYTRPEHISSLHDWLINKNELLGCLTTSDACFLVKEYFWNHKSSYQVMQVKLDLSMDGINYVQSLGLRMLFGHLGCSTCYTPRFMVEHGSVRGNYMGLIQFYFFKKENI